jgi:hypothetical protein
MNPMYSALAYSVARGILWVLASRIVEYGIWTSGDAEKYVGAAVPVVVSLAWSLYQVAQSRKLTLTALELAGATEHEAKKIMATTPSPPLSTPANAVPISPLPVADRLL